MTEISVVQPKLKFSVVETVFVELWVGIDAPNRYLTAVNGYWREILEAGTHWGTGRDRQSGVTVWDGSGSVLLRYDDYEDIMLCEG